MSTEEAIKNLEGFVEYFNDRIEHEKDPAFDREQAKKDVESFTLAIEALRYQAGILGNSIAEMKTVF